MTDYVHHFFQLLPVILACVAAVSCSMRFAKDRRKHDRWAMLTASFSAVLLIIAQTSWWTTYLIQHSLQGTEFANAIWTIFNSTTMLAFILMSQPWRRPQK